MKSCKPCYAEVDGKAGPDCPLRKQFPGLYSGYAAGCDLGREDKPPVGPQTSQHALQRPEPVMHDAKPAKLEKELQRQAEGWLATHGYRRMTAHEAIAASALGAFTKGWFFHLYIGRANSKAPLLPDLMIFDQGMTRCLQIELKVESVYQPGQKEMIDSGHWIEIRTFDEFRGWLAGWEKSR